MGERLVVYDDIHLFSYVSGHLVEREEGARRGEEAEGEGGGLLADEFVGAGGRGSGDAGKVARGDYQQAAGGDIDNEIYAGLAIDVSIHAPT